MLNTFFLPFTHSFSVSLPICCVGPLINLSRKKGGIGIGILSLSAGKFLTSSSLSLSSSASSARCLFARGIDMSSLKKIEELSTRHPNTSSKVIGYGTAGFRDKANVLDHVMFRMGVLAALRSKYKRATIGVMITASHNPEEDNGVKLVDPRGEMLENSWEKIATDVANAPDPTLLTVVEALVNQFGIDLTIQGSVFVGRDTRKSSPSLSQAVLDGISSIQDTKVMDFGLASTPILHYLVVCRNGNEAYGKCSKEGYYDKVSSAFSSAIGKEGTKGSYKPCLTVDCANGVGALEAGQVGKRIQHVLNLTLVNQGEGTLNYKCGADFVKVQQTFPENTGPSPGERFAALDGDADRLIYFYFDSSGKFRMLDGDKISLLFAEHLSDLVKKGKLEHKIGVVQTAYANGSSTNYAKDILEIPVACVPTGVKHLHHAALEFDIGVYFEANGHGTVVFSDKAVSDIRSSALSGGNEAARELSYFLDIINSTVGDAIADLLAVEAVLHSKGWGPQDWDGMYTDLPNRLLKVSVKDRNVIKTADAERKCVAPQGLQERIDQLVSGYPYGRSFVRPSGTEDIVRVYAEADTQENADALGAEVAKAVSELCG